MANPCTTDLPLDALQLDLTILDVMADLDPRWLAAYTASVEADPESAPTVAAGR